MQLMHDNCLSCHDEEKKKGGLTMTSRAALLKGSEDGKVVVPGGILSPPGILLCDRGYRGVRLLKSGIIVEFRDLASRRVGPSTGP